MPCANTDALPREDPTFGGGRVAPIAAILWRRPSRPYAGDKLGLYANEAGNIVARQCRKGRRHERKTRKLTDKNGAAKQGQKADEEKKNG